MDSFHTLKSFNGNPPGIYIVSDHGMGSKTGTYSAAATLVLSVWLYQSNARTLVHEFWRTYVWAVLG